MESEWRITTIDEVTKWFSGGTPSKNVERYWNGDIPWISASSMSGTRYYDSKLKLTAEGLEEGSRLASKGDILLLVRGSILHQQIPVGVAERDVSFNQDVKAIKAIESIVDPWFLFTWFLAKRNVLLNMVENTGIGAGKLDTLLLKNLIIQLPPKNEQLKIAVFSRALDDKIELNRKMNATLEEMAQALFKSWFVDFDPVIDNAIIAGNDIPEEFAERAEVRRKMLDDGSVNREVAGMFPDSLTFTEEMGWIPKGWECKEIRQRAKTIQYGLTQSASDEECGPRFLRITDIRGGEINWDQVPFCEISPAQFDKYKINKGDIFVARTGDSTGENVYVVSPEESVFASYLVRITFENKAIGRVAGMFMRTSQYFEYIAGILGGSAQPNASAQVLTSALMIFPSDDTSKLFYDKISLFDDRRVLNEREIRSLTNLRDTLLPKLISGELRISAAEKLVEDALA